ncbi:MAG: type IVB secretion system protein IcmH/DotU [Litoreibacter sp.]
MEDDDPFGLKNDMGRTRIRPKSRAQEIPQSRRHEASPQVATSDSRLRDTRSNNNELINAFSPLLGLAPELEAVNPPDNPDVLRARLLDNLTYARDTAVSAGLSLTQADKGAWFVAALLDDIALNTPWGGNSGWPSMPLVAELYGNVDAGTRFFDLTDDLLNYPERNPDLLQLAFLCLSLGFRGKHRISNDSGEAALTQLRNQIGAVIGTRDVWDQPLSPNWQGIIADDENHGFIVPIWAIGVVCAALLTAIYVGLGINLSNRGEQLYTIADILPPPERAAIFRPVIETLKEPKALEIPFELEMLPLFGVKAPPSTVRALNGREDVSLVILVVQATKPEVFRSSKAALNTEYDALIASVATVISENLEFIGQINVIGHTDSIPVQRSNPFQSNQRLSEARAKTIAEIFVSAGLPTSLITFEGRAASEPIADNATAEGRARNRRVEIVLQKKV